MGSVVNNYYTANYAGTQAIQNTKNYRSEWVYVDCIDGSDNNAGTLAKPYKTLLPVLKRINGMGQNANMMPNIYLRGNPTDTGVTRLYSWGDKTNSDVLLQGGVYCNQCLHIFFVGYNVELYWPGLNYLKKIYNGHINVQPRNGIWGVTADTDDMRMTWSWEGTADQGATYVHNWYFGLEHCNTTITQVDFAGAVLLNGNSGSFTNCSFERLGLLYCNNIIFNKNTRITATTSNLTATEYAAGAVGSAWKYGNVYIADSNNIEFLGYSKDGVVYNYCVDYTAPTSRGHTDSYDAAFQIQRADVRFLAPNLYETSPIGSTYDKDIYTQSTNIYTPLVKSNYTVYDAVSTYQYNSQWIN